jgi:hypothetical protein
MNEKGNCANLRRQFGEVDEKNQKVGFDKSPILIKKKSVFTPKVLLGVRTKKPFDKFGENFAKNWASFKNK